jgi:4a-hydroxytetrahydrobiopterin dehydratase
MQTLDDGEIMARLAQLTGWSRGAGYIEKQYQFKNFLRAMLFVNAVAYVAEAMNHHPDILIHYNEVTLRNWTHIAGGITARDFTLAEKIDALTPTDER